MTQLVIRVKLNHREERIADKQAKNVAHRCLAVEIEELWQENVYQEGRAEEGRGDGEQSRVSSKLYLHDKLLAVVETHESGELKREESFSPRFTIVLTLKNLDDATGWIEILLHVVVDAVIVVVDEFVVQAGNEQTAIDSAVVVNVFLPVKQELIALERRQHSKLYLGWAKSSVMNERRLLDAIIHRVLN